MTGWIYDVDPDGKAWVVTSDALGSDPYESSVDVRVSGDKRFVTGNVVSRSSDRRLNIISICCDESWRALTVAEDSVPGGEAELALFGYELSNIGRAVFGTRSFLVRPAGVTDGGLRYRVVSRAKNIGDDVHGPYIGGPIVDASGEVQGMMTTDFRWYFEWNHAVDGVEIRSFLDGFVRPVVTNFDLIEDEVTASLLQVFTNSSFGRAGYVTSGWIFQVDADGAAFAITAFSPFREARYDYLGARFQGEESWRAGEIVAYDAEVGITVFRICCNHDWKPFTVAEQHSQEFDSSSFVFGIKQVFEDSAWFFDSQLAYVPLDLGKGESVIASRFSEADSLVSSLAGSPVLNGSGEIVGIVTNQDGASGSTRRVVELQTLRDFLTNLRDEVNIVFTNVSRPQLPPNHEIVVGDDVSQADIHQFVRAASNLHEYAVFAGIPVTNEPKTIYIEHDRAALAGHFVTVQGWSEDDASTYTKEAPIPGGTAGVNRAYHLVDKPLPEGAHQYTPWIVDGHEIVHGVYQYGLGGVHTDRDWFRQHPSESPPWMGEGVALVFQQLAFCHSRGVPYLHNEWDKAKVLEWDGTLADIDGYEPDEWGSPYKYSAGTEAVELLVSIVGVSRLFDFYTMMRPNEPWQSTFSRAYGVSVEEFYEMFEQHKAAGLPDLQLPIRVEIDRE